MSGPRNFINSFDPTAQLAQSITPQIEPGGALVVINYSSYILQLSGDGISAPFIEIPPSYKFVMRASQDIMQMSIGIGPQVPNLLQTLNRVTVEAHDPGELFIDVSHPLSLPNGTVPAASVLCGTLPTCVDIGAALPATPPAASPITDDERVGTLLFGAGDSGVYAGGNSAFLGSRSGACLFKLNNYWDGLADRFIKSSTPAFQFFLKSDGTLHLRCDNGTNQVAGGAITWDADSIAVYTTVTSPSIGIGADPKITPPSAAVIGTALFNFATSGIWAGTAAAFLSSSTQCRLNVNTYSDGLDRYATAAPAFQIQFNFLNSPMGLRFRASTDVTPVAGGAITWGAFVPMIDNNGNRYSDAAFIQPGAIGAGVTLPGSQVTGDLAANQIGPGALDTDVTMLLNEVQPGTAPNGQYIFPDNATNGTPLVAQLASTFFGDLIKLLVDGTNQEWHVGIDASGSLYIFSKTVNAIVAKFDTGSVSTLSKLALTSGSTFTRLSSFSATGVGASTAVNHGLGAVPFGVLVCPTTNASSATIGAFSFTSTQITLDIGGGGSWSIVGLAWA